MRYIPSHALNLPHKLQIQLKQNFTPKMTIYTTTDFLQNKTHEKTIHCPTLKKKQSVRFVKLV